MSLYTGSLRSFLTRALPADGTPVAWRSVLLLAEEFAPRATVQADLYALLHDTLDVQWGGARGGRWVARAPSPADVMSVGCPACGVASGEPCRARNAPTQTTAHAHDARQERAVLNNPNMTTETSR